MVWQRVKFSRLFSIVLRMVALGLCVQGNAGTVGFWRFEEGTPPNAATGVGSVLDSSGHGLNATPSGGPTYSSDLPPMAGATTRSMHFDGLGQRLFVPDQPILQLTHSLTIEAFVKSFPMQPGTDGGGNILVRGDTRPSLDPYRLTLNNGNSIYFGIMNAAETTAFLTYTIPYGSWVHIAGTLDDATGAMKLYVNGALVASTVTSIRPFGTLDPGSSPGLGIGADQTGEYGEYLNGWLDEVRLSDVALSPAQFLIPEPSGLAMMGLGIAALLQRRASKAKG